MPALRAQRPPRKRAAGGENFGPKTAIFNGFRLGKRRNRQTRSDGLPHSDALLVSASWLPPAAPAASAAPARVPAALQSCFWFRRRPSSHSNQCASCARHLARRSPPLLGVLLGVSCASAQTCAAERRRMLTGVNDFSAIHTPFPIDLKAIQP